MNAVQDGAGLLPAYRGTLDALRTIMRQEGWRALYSGACAAMAAGLLDGRLRRAGQAAGACCGTAAI